jgi:hypothetical protein
VSWRQRAAACLIAAMMLAACGSDRARTATSPAPPSDAADSPAPTVTALTGRPPRPLRGTWKRHITAEDWHRAHEEFSPGTWRLKIEQRGRVKVYTPGAHYVDFSAQLGVNRSALTVGTIPLCATVGSYRWRVSSERLTIATLEDASCGPRAALFAGTWRRSRGE